MSTYKNDDDYLNYFTEWGLFKEHGSVVKKIWKKIEKLPIYDNNRWWYDECIFQKKENYKSSTMAFLDWTELNNKLEKTFKFENYNEVVLFTNQVMQIAIEQDHHPEMHVHYNFVKLLITDYEKGAVSQKCHRFISAVNIVQLPSSNSASNSPASHPQ